MPRPRVISAKNRPFKHVELSEGDWINLKQKLNYGEASDLYDATYRSGVGGGAQRGTQREVRMSEFNMQRIFIYTLAWSFVDDENKPLPLTPDTIRQLDTETTEEIHAAINDIENENAAKESEGKANGTGQTATPSVSAEQSVTTPAGSSRRERND